MATTSQKMTGPMIKDDKDIDVRKRAFLIWPIAVLLVVAAVVLYMMKAQNDAEQVAPGVTNDVPTSAPATEPVK